MPAQQRHRVARPSTHETAPAAGRAAATGRGNAARLRSGDGPAAGSFSLGGDLAAMAAAMGVGDGLLKQGDRGAGVRALQAALGMPAGEQDGAFGPRTHAAVVAFQRSAGLMADGIVGPDTHGALTRRSAPAQPTPAPRAPAPAPRAATAEAGHEDHEGRDAHDAHHHDHADEAVDGGLQAAHTLQDATADGKLVRQGASGPAVLEIQKLLGVGPSGQTGQFDAATADAIKRFQRANRLSPDGVVGPATMSALLRSGVQRSVDQGVIFEEGATGPGVLALQQALGMGAGGQTGEFGPTTAQMVRSFQTKNNIQATGKVGPTTWEALKVGGAMPGRYLGKFDAYQNGRHLGKIDVVEIDGEKVAAKTARAWTELKAAAARDGVRLVLNSGFRTHAEQQSLYRSYQNGTGNLAAYPGYSNHQHGQALDIDVTSDAAYDWMHARAPSLGWRRTVPSEPWHWEYFGN